MLSSWLEKQSNSSLNNHHDCNGLRQCCCYAVSDSDWPTSTAEKKLKPTLWTLLSLRHSNYINSVFHHFVLSGFNSAYVTRNVTVMFVDEFSTLCLYGKTGHPLTFKCQDLEPIQCRASAAPRFILARTLPPHIAAFDSLQNSRKTHFLNAYLIVYCPGGGFFSVLCQVSKITSQQGKHFWEANVFSSLLFLQGSSGQLTQT